jgi:Flp pilus assembly protein TadG
MEYPARAGGAEADRADGCGAEAGGGDGCGAEAGGGDGCGAGMAVAGMAVGRMAVGRMAESMRSGRRHIIAGRRALRNAPERGAGGESLELVIIAIGLIVVILIGIAAGRASIASGRVDQAAAAGARAASLTRTTAAAEVAATDAAGASLATAGLTCQNMNIDVDTSGFGAPAGEPASVVVRVTCVVEWGDLGIPLWPGSKTYTSSAASPLDIHRERL